MTCLFLSLKSKMIDSCRSPVKYRKMENDRFILIFRFQLYGSIDFVGIQADVQRKEFILIIII